MQIVQDKSLIIALKTVIVNLTWLRDIHSQKRILGESERILKMVKKDASKRIIVITKVTGRNNESQYGNNQMVNYNRIRNSIKSLNRLNSDYIDVFSTLADRYTIIGRKFITLTRIPG